MKENKSVALKENSGITLIALVITIIVLLILAGVSIAMISGNNGILSKSGEAIVKQQIGTAQDKCVLIASDTLADYYYDIYVNVNGEAYSGDTLDADIITAITTEGALDVAGVTATKGTEDKEFTLKYTDGSTITGTLANGKITWSGYQYAGNE